MKSGFTLIEVLVALAIGAFITAGGLPVGWELYRQNLFQAESNLLIQLIQVARAESLNDEGGVAHGVQVTTTSYVLFSGNQYDPIAPSNESFSRNLAVEINGSTSIIFSPLTAITGVSGPQTLSLSLGNQNESVTIGSNGELDW